MLVGGQHEKKKKEESNILTHRPSISLNSHAMIRRRKKSVKKRNCAEVLDVLFCEVNTCAKKKKRALGLSCCIRGTNKNSANSTIMHAHRASCKAFHVYFTTIHSYIKKNKGKRNEDGQRPQLQGS